MLEVVSDTICPWCYIGKRQLDAALDMLGNKIQINVRWRPFELNPDMPREGIDRQIYRSRKFGSWEKSLVLDAQVAEAGKAVGLDFRHESIAKTPNTLSSHVIVRLAEDMGVQDQLVESLFKAYFKDGQDVGDTNVLTNIGASCGIDRGRIAEALADDMMRDEVKIEAMEFSNAGISSVPSVLLDSHLLFSGAQPSQSIAAALSQLVLDR